MSRKFPPSQVNTHITPRKSKNATANQKIAQNASIIDSQEFPLDAEKVSNENINSKCFYDARQLQYANNLVDGSRPISPSVSQIPALNHFHYGCVIDNDCGEKVSPGLKVLTKKTSDVKHPENTPNDKDLNSLLTMEISVSLLTNENLRKQVKRVIRKKSSELIKKGDLHNASEVLKKLDEIEEYEKENKKQAPEKPIASISVAPVNSANATTTSTPAKRLQYWYGFCSKRKSDSTNNTPDNHKSRFIPFRLQLDSYLGKLDVNYENFDKNSFELGLNPNSNPITTCIHSPSVTLTNDAKKYREHDFKSVLTRPHYTAHFTTKVFTDENVERFKLFQLHDNIRPPYFGTLSNEQKNINIPRKNPFYTHNLIKYDVDSDEEWYEEEPGEDLSKSDGDEELDQTLVDEADLDGFLVPHGYLSLDERDSLKAKDENMTSKLNETNNFPNSKNDNNGEPKKKVVSSQRPVIFGITYLEDGTQAADNFSYFLNAEKIRGGVFKYSSGILKPLHSTLNKSLSNPPVVSSSNITQISIPRNFSLKRNLADPLEIDKHICDYFVTCGCVRNLKTVSTSFYQYWTDRFPNEPRLAKKLIFDRLKALTFKSNAVYSLKDPELSQL